jgi:hypothetical protein
MDTVISSDAGRPVSARLTAQSFARGLIAELVRRGRTSIEPHGSSDRAGFFRAMEEVTKFARQLGQEGSDPSLYQDSVRIRNALKPSNNGSFDGLERLLRSQQLSLTASPNPFYEQIALNLSRPYAESLLQEFEPEQRELISRAVSAFLGTTD